LPIPDLARVRLKGAFRTVDTSEDPVPVDDPRTPMLGKKRPRRVLIADDDPDILKIIKTNLQAEGIEVEAVANGWEAQLRALKTLPDLVILDISMPGRNGLEVMAAMKAHAETADIPVVLLTARASDADVWEGWKAGAAYYLTKPFDPAQLLHYVNYLFDHSVHSH
jgi:two-component system, OmpR family, alkaline phosphatase synthesis response regulator PhoP